MKSVSQIWDIKIAISYLEKSLSFSEFFNSRIKPYSKVCKLLPEEMRTRVYSVVIHETNICMRYYISRLKFRELRFKNLRKFYNSSLLFQRKVILNTVFKGRNIFNWIAIIIVWIVRTKVDNFYADWSSIDQTCVSPNAVTCMPTCFVQIDNVISSSILSYNEMSTCLDFNLVAS